MRFVLSNSYGTPNVGDEAILTVLVDELTTAGHEVEVLSFWPAETQRKQPQAAAVKSGVFRGLFDTIAAIRRADRLVIGGGGILQEATSRGNLIFHLSRTWIARLCGTDYVLAGVGVGPVTSRLGRFLLASACRSALSISVRDEESCALLVELGIGRDSISVDADLAHLLRTNQVPANVDSGQLQIGLSLRPPVGSRSERNIDSPDFLRWLHSIVQIIDLLIEQRNAQFTFVSMNIEQDDAIGSFLQQHVANPAALSVSSGDASPADVARVLATTDVVIGMRLHALILAAGQNVPGIGLAYIGKVRSFLVAIGFEMNVFEPEGLASEQLVSAIDRCISDPASVQRKLQSAIARQVAAAKRAIAEIQRVS